MSSGFWSSLKRPIFALAPMHDVTDTAFRQLLAKTVKPSVMFTEFVSVDGLTHPNSREKMVKHYLQYNETERPLVAQIWGNDPQKFFEVAQLIQELGFDGVDINMGCPDKKVVSLGGGAALMQDAHRAVEIIKVTQEATTLPVSVKTRLGFNTIDTSFIQKIASTQPVAMTIHARTKKELSLVPAHWDVLAHIAPDLQKEGIIVLGNGDIKTYQEALQRAEEAKLDGIMIGRGVFGNPWIFSNIKAVSLADKLHILIEHAELFSKSFGETKNFNMLKKHIHGYVNGFNGAKEMRNEIMKAKTIEEMKKILGKILNSKF